MPATRRRDFQAEYQARVARSRERGFESYAQERAARQALQARAQHPGFRRYEWDEEEAFQPKGQQLPQGMSNDPGWVIYDPTKTTTKTGRPYTRAARWSPRFGILEVVFRDGTPWTYPGVDRNGWDQFRNAASPKRVLREQMAFGYGARGGYGSIVGE
jgi:hypothetical protein